MTEEKSQIQVSARYRPRHSPAVDLSIVIPCFNEVSGIRETSRSVLAYVSERYPDLSTELVLVDDGSTDGTGDLLRELAQGDLRVRPVFFLRNRGRGAALKAGIAATTGELVITLDADLSYDVDHIGQILDRFSEQPKTDVVVVSPYMKGGITQGVPFSRLVLSRSANWILAGFFAGRISTVTCVVRGYRGDLVRSLPFFEDSKELHLEMLRKIALCGGHIEEIPGRLVWHDSRRNAKRGVGLKVVDAAARHLFYAMLIKPTRIFKAVAILLFLVGIWEIGNVLLSFLHHYQPEPSGFWFSVWKALAASFHYSPHTFFLAGICLVLSFQAFSYLALTQVMKSQQEETLRHLVALLQSKAPRSPADTLTH